jgi:hypothetical protein
MDITENQKLRGEAHTQEGDLISLLTKGGRHREQGDLKTGFPFVSFLPGQSHFLVKCPEYIPNVRLFKCPS